MMQMVFKVVYSVMVAMLFVLFVILGTRTFYEEPEEPTHRYVPAPSTGRVFCEQDGCFRDGQELTAEDEAKLTEEERLYVQQEREFAEKWQAYEDDRADYHRNVFILASLLGVAAVAVGLYLFQRVEAMPLGLLLGGLGVVIFGWAQSAEDFGEIGVAPMFAAVAVGLAVVLGVGYRFLALKRPGGNGRS